MAWRSMRLQDILAASARNFRGQAVTLHFNVDYTATVIPIVRTVRIVSANAERDYVQLYRILESPLCR